MEYFLLIIGAMFVNNFVLCQFLGCCPFLGVSKKTDTALGMGLAVIFVMGIASVFTWLVQKLLVAAGIEYLQTIAFILVIAALVQTVELLLKRFMPALYSALGVYLPLITTNCAVLGVAILNIQSFGTVGAERASCSPSSTACSAERGSPSRYCCSRAYARGWISRRCPSRSGDSPSRS